MAKNISFKHTTNKRRKRKGVHAKSKNSKVKGAKHYRKRYRGQGH